MPQTYDHFPKFRASQLNRTIAGMREADLASMARSNPLLFDEWTNEVEAQLQMAPTGDSEQTAKRLMNNLRTARQSVAARIAA